MYKIINFFADKRVLSIAVFVACASALASAFIGEYVFNYKPCILCLTQRVPYAVNMVLAIIALVSLQRNPKLSSVVFWVIVVSFAFNASVAGYQAGMEYKWWTNFLTNCSANQIGKTVEDLQKMFAEQTRIVPCDIPQFTLFGISFAGYNFIVSSFAVAMMSFLLKFKPSK